MTFIRIFLVLAAMQFNGCITIRPANSDVNAIKKIQIGIVLVEYQSASTGLTYTEYTTGGAWFEIEGAGIGLKNEFLVSADPKCQVIFITKSKEQLEHAHMLLKSTLDRNEGKICLEK